MARTKRRERAGRGAAGRAEVSGFVANEQAAWLRRRFAAGNLRRTECLKDHPC